MLRRSFIIRHFSLRVRSCSSIIRIIKVRNSDSMRKFRKFRSNMPNPSTDPIWRERVYSIAAGPPEMRSARQVYGALEKKARELGWTGYPSQRVVDGFWSDWKKLAEREQLAYRQFSWPASMVLEAVPWEATETVMELLREYADPNGLGLSGRPSNLKVLWYWRISLAAPDLDASIRNKLATALQLQETVSEMRQDSPAFPWYPRLDLFLAMKPWQAEEQRQAYREAIQSIESGLGDDWHPKMRNIQDRWEGPVKWHDGAREIISSVVEPYLEESTNEQTG
jgi:hypothetical protein